MLNRKRDIARAVADGYISHSPIIFLSPLEFCGRIPVQGILSARRTATGRNLMRLGPRRRTPAYSRIPISGLAGE